MLYILHNESDSRTFSTNPPIYQPTYLSNQSTHIFPPTHPPTQPSTPFRTNLSICPTTNPPTHLMHTSIHHQSPPHLSVTGRSQNRTTASARMLTAPRPQTEVQCSDFRHLQSAVNRPSRVNGYIPHQSSSHSVHSFGNDNHVIIFGSEMSFGLVINQCSVEEHHTGQ